MPGIAVEYHHEAFDHYFITHIPAEIAALDGGLVSGWKRTGRTFRVYEEGQGTRVNVCRHFSGLTFAPKSSHFYSAIPEECAILQGSPVWGFEGYVFWVQPANPASGACPAGTLGVYRLYNQGQGGAPNHRYTTEPAVRIEMIGKGWIPEGYGVEGVGFCVPPS